MITSALRELTGHHFIFKRQQWPRLVWRQVLFYCTLVYKSPRTKCARKRDVSDECTEQCVAVAKAPRAFALTKFNMLQFSEAFYPG